MRPSGYSVELNMFKSLDSHIFVNVLHINFFNVNSVYSGDMSWLINWVIKHLSVLSNFSGSFREPFQCHQWSQWSMLQCGWLITSEKLTLFCKYTTPWMFLPLDILLEYWIEHVSFGLLYVMFTFPTRIFYRGVPAFATDCPCGVWCCGLTTCPLYVGPLFWNLI